MSIPAVKWDEFLINAEMTENVQNGVQLQALADGKFVAVWQQEVINELGVRSVELYAQRFYSGAVPEGEPIRIDTTVGGMNSAPTVTVLSDGKLVYTWEHQSINEAGVMEYSIRARIFKADGTPFDRNGADEGGTDDFEVVAASETQVSSPLVEALSNGGFVIAYNKPGADWDDSQGVHAQVFNAAGQVLGDGPVNARISEDQEIYALVGLPGGKFLAIYSAWPPTGDAVALGAAICTTAGDISNGGVNYSLPMSPKKGTVPAVEVLSDGRILIAWTEISSDGTGDNVMAQIFDATTMGAVGAAFIVSNSTAGDQSMPSITALRGGGFAITYLDTDGTSIPNVRVAVFDNSYVRRDDTLVSEFSRDGTRGTPKLIELLDGRLIAAWDEDIPGRAGDDAGIRGRVIDARFQGINMPGTANDDQWAGTEFNDTLNGGAAGDDDLNGREGDDVLIGGSGDDRLNGGEGADHMNGGTGNDVYYIDHISDVVSEAGGSGTDTVYTSINYTLAANVENLTAIGTGAITLTGNELANTITGNSASNTINGGAGNDFMAGGQGDDTYYVDSAGDHVSEAAGEGTDKIIVGFNYTLGDNVENLEVTGSGNLTLNGNSLNNHIKGNGGANVLNGGAGNDTLDGGSGADRMVGGADSDKYYVDNVKDVVVEDKGGGYYDEVVTTINYTLGANVEWGWIWNAKGLTLTGNSLNNHLNGNVGNDKLNGGAGNDTLVGGAGADTMTGGSGNDSYFVDNKKDKVIETAKGGKADMVTTGLKYTLGAHVEHLTGVGNSALSLTGNSLSNKIIGNDGKSTIKGLAGNDTIDGGYGNDVLYGGQGKDAFVFSTGFDKGSNVDTIKDFNVKDDTIHLDNAIFKSLTKNGKLSKSFFKIGPKAKDADDYVIYDNKKGILYYDADGSGAGAAIKIATLGKKLKMTAADFLVI